MRITKYILLEYLKFVGATLILCIFLLSLFDFVHKSSNYFNRYQAGLDLVVQYYFYQAPFFIVQCLPIASLLASVVCMIMFNRSNEIAAMRAVGMNIYKILLPVFLGGVIIGSCTHLISEYLVPSSAKTQHHLSRMAIERQESDELNDDLFWSRRGNSFFNFRDYDFKQKKLFDIRLVHVLSDFSFEKIIQAQSATLNQGERDWTLHNVKVISIKNKNNLENFEVKESLVLRLPVDVQKLQTDYRIPEEMSRAELKDMIHRRQQSGAQSLYFQVAWHIKTAFPFGVLLLSLFGIRFAFRSERSSGMVKGILLSVILALGYWGMLSAGKAVAELGNIPPFLGGWAANIYLLGINIINILQLKKL